jgi:C4-dicarboxylate-specific signal transduction histidine kinase
LNQPLGAILNYAGACLEQAESRRELPPSMLTALREIMNESRRAGAIISRLRSFVRKQSPRGVPLDVNELVEESINLLGFELHHQGIRPRLLLTEPLPKVVADPIHIEQVLVNLMYNALEAMEESGKSGSGVTVQTALAPGGAVEVSIIDNGPGVAPDRMPRLFEAFFTTKPKGLGMGLNISRTIIESHGGRLEAAANPGGGMKFSFTLPLARKEPV